jgi:S-adenosylmethionine decarboxylase proenzyme
MPALGHHLLADLKGCDPSRLSDLACVREAMLEAARVSGATIITHTFHHFAPLGISGVVIVSESHLAIHTWPEHAFAAVDFFTCGKVDAAKALEHLREAFRCARVETLEVCRGPLEVLPSATFPAGR